MKTHHKAILILAILLLCVGCDQATKNVARNQLPSSRAVEVVGDLFRFQYSENTGALLSLGAGLPEAVRIWILQIFVGLVLVSLLVVALSAHRIDRVTTVGIALIAGGGFSNLLDRLMHQGAVVDFMNMGLGSLRTGVFNLADVAIMAGAAIMALGFWRTANAERSGPAGSAEP